MDYCLQLHVANPTKLLDNSSSTSSLPRPVRKQIKQSKSGLILASKMGHHYKTCLTSPILLPPNFFHAETVRTCTMIESLRYSTRKHFQTRKWLYITNEKMQVHVRTKDTHKYTHTHTRIPDAGLVVFT